MLRNTAGHIDITIPYFVIAIRSGDVFASVIEFRIKPDPLTNISDQPPVRMIQNIEVGALVYLQNNERIVYTRQVFIVHHAAMLSVVG